jgi:hypothetical protein
MMMNDVLIFLFSGHERARQRLLHAQHNGRFDGRNVGNKILFKPK